MPVFGNMPNAKILQPSISKYAKFVFSGRKWANLATLVVLAVSKLTRPSSLERKSPLIDKLWTYIFALHFIKPIWVS